MLEPCMPHWISCHYFPVLYCTYNFLSFIPLETYWYQKSFWVEYYLRGGSCPGVLCKGSEKVFFLMMPHIKWNFATGSNILPMQKLAYFRIVRAHDPSPILETHCHDFMWKPKIMVYFRCIHRMRLVWIFY